MIRGVDEKTVKCRPDALRHGVRRLRVLGASVSLAVPGDGTDVPQRKTIECREKRFASRCFLAALQRAFGTTPGLGETGARRVSFTTISIIAPEKYAGRIGILSDRGASHTSDDNRTAGSPCFSAGLGGAPRRSALFRRCPEAESYSLGVVDSAAASAGARRRMGTEFHRPPRLLGPLLWLVQPGRRCVLKGIPTSGLDAWPIVKWPRRRRASRSTRESSPP